MSPYDMIYQRKSVRSYSAAPLSADVLRQVRELMKGLKPLYPEIPVQGEILPRDQVKCLLPWIPPQVIAIFTDDSMGALENAGFMFQQLELKLECMGLGVCWLGMGRLSPRAHVPGTDGLKCVMMMAFGEPKEAILRTRRDQFRRKSMAEISDSNDIRLEPALLAPSSVNSQPWRFTHDGETIHVHCIKQPLARMLSNMNRIDMGICLAQLYVSHPESFRFFRNETATSPKGCAYIGSITL